MKKLLCIFGTRPEAIKMAPVVSRLNDCPGFRVVLCVTGQHREMLDQVMKSFELVPDIDLNIMKPDQDLFDVTLNSLQALRAVMKEEKPDLLLVQGDTTTAFAAGLSAFYLRIPVGHIEAGLRTHDKYNPFPEEKNRHLLSVLSDYHFAPTDWARSNLAAEGVPENSIWVTGNTVIDALFAMQKRQEQDALRVRLEEYFRWRWNLDLAHGPESGGKVLMVTGHRRESFGKGFEEICLALKDIAEQRTDVDIIYPVHLNPNVQRPVRSVLSAIPNVHLIDPLGYEQFIFLMSRSYFILTDSGGMQEEAPALSKPVLVMRSTTERPEGVRAGVARLVGTDRRSITSAVLQLLTRPDMYRKMAASVNPYGDGQAASRIAGIIESELLGHRDSLGKGGQPAAPRSFPNKT